MWTTVIFLATTGLFLAWTIYSLWHVRWMRRLPALESLSTGPTASSAKCSVVIAARDEEARIEQTIRRLLAQRDVDLEIIVVDDRSTDRTGKILRHLANEDARIQLKRVDVLPDSWLGKCHACHIGASSVTSDWILFTDADCWLKPDMIARALRLAEREQADHVALTSGIAVQTPGSRAGHLAFLLTLANWFSGVNRDRPKSFLGFGAFNLVRAPAYRQCGGYEVLRLTVLDDVKLGLLLRRAGKRTRAFIGGDDVECHWGATLRATVKLLEKNYFAAVDYRTGLVVGGSLIVLSIFTVLIFALISGTVAGLVAALSSLSLILPAAILARRLGWPWPSAVGVPFMFPVFLYACLNSTFKALRRGGIRWRETFYPLAALRAGNVQ